MDIIYVSFDGKEWAQVNSIFQSQFNYSTIFSDVDINFHSNRISSVTSLNLDSKGDSRKSDGNLSSNIQQLIIDIQNLDDSAASKILKDSIGKTITVTEDLITSRMSRFLKAFNSIFDGLSYDGIKNNSGEKKIAFKRNDKTIFLDNLSSGEQQIIYRSSFMLKDINALSGALVLIDEPEISMHPEWQKKIMQFYKNIFTDENGVQTSQIFAVTHSPFVIHNDFRRNDKVIVLTKTEDGFIKVLDRPEYYVCNSKKAVADAFKQEWFQPVCDSVYLEGRTDKKYFDKAMDIFAYSDLPFKFKWIGHLTPKEQEEFTGKDALNKAYQFSLSAKYEFKQVFLFDCDVNRDNFENSNSILWGIKKTKNERFKVGIENSLDISDIPEDKFAGFYINKKSLDDYGGEKVIPEFEKMKFCDYICSLDDIQLKKIFANLKTTIEELITLFSK